jgi:hypothetical protein
MRLKTCLIVLIASLASSCAGLPIPEKPKVEVGIIDYPRNEVITNQIDSRKIKSKKQLRYAVMRKNMLASKFIRKPLADYDKAISFKPAAWEQLQNYLDKLEDYARNRCQ